MTRTHQPGYLEAKAVRLLKSIRQHVAEGNCHWSPGFEKLWTDDDAKAAWHIVNNALTEARQAQRVVRQLIRGY